MRLLVRCITWHPPLSLSSGFRGKVHNYLRKKRLLWVEHRPKSFPFFLSSRFLLKCTVHSVAPWWSPTDAMTTAPSVTSHKTHYRQIKHEHNISFQNFWKVLSKNIWCLVSTISRSLLTETGWQIWPLVHYCALASKLYREWARDLQGDPLTREQWKSCIARWHVWMVWYKPIQPSVTPTVCRYTKHC